MITLTMSASCARPFRNVAISTRTVYTLPVMGMQALAFITRLDPFADAPRAGLIIVDLNMPGIDGYGVLVAVKQMEASHNIPVIMFSDSDSQFDVKKAYDLYANCYIVKPRDFRAFADTICSLITFWTEKAALPPA